MARFLQLVCALVSVFAIDNAFGLQCASYSTENPNGFCGDAGICYGEFSKTDNGWMTVKQYCIQADYLTSDILLGWSSVAENSASVYCATDFCNQGPPPDSLKIAAPGGFKCNFDDGKTKSTCSGAYNCLILNYTMQGQSLISQSCDYTNKIFITQSLSETQGCFIIEGDRFGMPYIITTCSCKTGNKCNNQALLDTTKGYKPKEPVVCKTPKRNIVADYCRSDQDTKGTDTKVGISIIGSTLPEQHARLGCKKIYYGGYNITQTCICESDCPFPDPWSTTTPTFNFRF